MSFVLSRVREAVAGMQESVIVPEYHISYVQIKDYRMALGERLHEIERFDLLIGQHGNTGTSG